MVVGAVSLPSNELACLNQAIKDIKQRHNHKRELKWIKLIQKQVDFYSELLKFFFSNAHLRFRAVLIPDKTLLRHDIYNDNNPDLFYYKMFYYVLRRKDNLAESQIKMKIYLDYKDSKCAARMRELERVLKPHYVQCFTIRSYESQIIQLTDLFIGAIAYKARDDIDHKSEIKNYLVKEIEALAHCDLKHGTLPSEEKFNVFKIKLR